MELKARLNNSYRDFATNKVIVSLEVDYEPKLDTIRDKDLRVEIKEWREQRSKAANSYFHVLVRRLAEVLHSSETEQKNIMLARYGQPEILDNGKYMTLSLADYVEWTKLDFIHLKPTAEVEIKNEEVYRTYVVMRGSSTYDTREMSRLLDMTIEDAKAQGIETLTPNEIERMKQYWRPEKK